MTHLSLITSGTWNHGGSRKQLAGAPCVFGYLAAKDPVIQIERAT